MPVRIPPTATVFEPATIIPRNLPNNRPPVMVRPDWVEPPRVRRTWNTEITSSSIADEEQRVGRWNRPLTSAASVHHGTDQEETSWLWNMLEGASPQMILSALPRLEMTSPLAYSWPFGIAADYVNVTANLTDLGGGQARITVETTDHRRFYAGARLWLYSRSAAEEPNVRHIRQGTRRLPGLLLTIADVQPTHIDVLLDLGTAGITFPAVGVLAVFPAFDALPIYSATQEYLGCSRSRVEIDADEYPGPNQYPPLNDGDVSALYPYFLGAPVWRPDHNWRQGMRIGFQRSGGNTDSGRGLIPVLSGLNPRITLEVDSLLPRDRWWDVLQLFDSRRGMLRSFWVVTDAALFGPQTLAAPSTVFAGLPQRGYEAHLNSILDAVGFIRSNGTFAMAQTVSVTFDAGTGTLTLQTAQPIPAGSYVKVVYAFRGRFAQDSIEESWITCDLVRSRFSILQVNAELARSI